MAKLLGIRIQNYRALVDFAIGQTQYAEGDALPELSCFIGRNGSGKSTLLDALGFIADCLIEGVEAACDKPSRGGFERLRTQGGSGPIAFEIYFDGGDKGRPIVYDFSIDLVEAVPQVVHESLRQRRKGEVKGRLYHFLKVANGKGSVWAGQYVSSQADAKAKQSVHLADTDHLAITTLGNLAAHPRIVLLRKYIEGWYLSYFVPDAARELPPAGAQRWLDNKGSNVANVLEYFQRQNKGEDFNRILDRVTQAIPGLRKITPEPSPDRRLLLRFEQEGFAEPFYQQSMSDGTLKMLAYATLLADPEPRPFIGIEEPENGLYVELIEVLARQLQGFAADKKRATQVLLTTHSPYFVDGLRPEQVWVVSKDKMGRASATRCADMPHVKEMTAEGLPLGSLWYSKHFDANGGAKA
jgi:predicted ATPase